MDKKLMQWFQSKYNFREFGIAMRDFQTNSIIKNDNRYIVKDMFPEKIDGSYFYVYKNKPVKHKETNSEIYGDPLTEYAIQTGARR
jgi:hypothetical protein